MIESILVPVDFAHKDALDAALTEAGKLAKANKARLTLVSVTGSAPSEAAHNPKEYEKKNRLTQAKLPNGLGFRLTQNR